MNNPIWERISSAIMHLKARSVIRRVSHSLKFPTTSAVVRNVLVILPRDLLLLDSASDFVQSLKKTYPGWKVELFDVDKLGKADLNSMRLPRQPVLDKLRQADYHLVMDLNKQRDALSAYIALMTEAPYRLELQQEESIFYNMVYQPQQNGNQIYYEPLLNYLRRLFVKN